LNPYCGFGKHDCCQLQHAPNTGAKLRNYKLPNFFFEITCGEKILESKRDLEINQVPITTKPEVPTNYGITSQLLAVTLLFKKSRLMWRDSKT